MISTPHPPQIAPVGGIVNIQSGQRIIKPIACRPQQQYQQMKGQEGIKSSNDNRKDSLPDTVFDNNGDVSNTGQKQFGGSSQDLRNNVIFNSNNNNNHYAHLPHYTLASGASGESSLKNNISMTKRAAPTVQSSSSQQQQQTVVPPNRTHSLNNHRFNSLDRRLFVNRNQKLKQFAPSSSNGESLVNAPDGMTNSHAMNVSGLPSSTCNSSSRYGDHLPTSNFNRRMTTTAVMTTGATSPIAKNNNSSQNNFDSSASSHGLLSGANSEDSINLLNNRCSRGANKFNSNYADVYQQQQRHQHYPTNTSSSTHMTPTKRESDETDKIYSFPTKNEKMILAPFSSSSSTRLQSSGSFSYKNSSKPNHPYSMLSIGGGGITNNRNSNASLPFSKRQQQISRSESTNTLAGGEGGIRRIMSESVDERSVNNNTCLMTSSAIFTTCDFNNNSISISESPIPGTSPLRNHETLHLDDDHIHKMSTPSPSDSAVVADCSLVSAITTPSSDGDGLSSKTNSCCSAWSNGVPIDSQFASLSSSCHMNENVSDPERHQFQSEQSPYLNNNSGDECSSSSRDSGYSKVLQEDKERLWEREIRRLKGIYENRLRAAQAKASRMEQALTSQTYQLQHEKSKTERDADRYKIEVEKYQKENIILRHQMQSFKGINLGPTTTTPNADKTCPATPLSVSLDDHTTSTPTRTSSSASNSRKLPDLKVTASYGTPFQNGRMMKSVGANSTPINHDNIETDEEGGEGSTQMELVTRQKEIIIERDCQIDQLRGQLERQANDNEKLREEVERNKHSFTTERQMWLDEKDKVIRYQKQLQLNYVQIYKQNSELKKELEVLEKSVASYQQQQNFRNFQSKNCRNFFSSASKHSSTSNLFLSTFTSSGGSSGSGSCNKSGFAGGAPGNQHEKKSISKQDLTSSGGSGGVKVKKSNSVRAKFLRMALLNHGGQSSSSKSGARIHD